jgi:hypothetical protein
MVGNNLIIETRGIIDKAKILEDNDKTRVLEVIDEMIDEMTTIRITHRNGQENMMIMIEILLIEITIVIILIETIIIKEAVEDIALSSEYLNP